MEYMSDGVLRTEPMHMRFDADADMRLVLAVRRWEPYAAEHGTRTQVWDQVVADVDANMAVSQGMAVYRRAVTDRWVVLCLEMFMLRNR